MELTWWQTTASSENNNANKDNDDDDDDQIGPHLSMQQLRDLKRQREFEKLVRREEKIGRQKLYERRVKQGLVVADPEKKIESQQADASSSYANKNDNNDNNEPSSQQQEQEQSYMEFDGPCVICLEPDLESKQDLMTLRQVLQQDGGLGALYSPFCATATVDPSLIATTPSTFTKRLRGGDFRPVIPIASFATVSQAIPVAQKLRKLWEPLQWEVTDLHILESTASHQKQINGEESLDQQQQMPPIWGFAPKKTQAALSSDKQQMMMGCSALISLYGEEMEMDDELNEEIANLVAKTGQDGGGSGAANNADNSGASSSASFTADDLNVQRHGSIDDIEAFLEDDNEADYDEGTVVVIGRVHFFTGDARIYQGMPATSTSVYDLSASFKKTNTNTTTAKGGK
uniref:Uncharacterized protein n=1 Tax=Amphora coffeiformis TaxID=265554 RepID=A0A7S3KZF8_9STRA